MNRVLTTFFIILSVCSAMAATAVGQKLKPEEIVAKHLESIGSAEARAAAKTRMMVGDASVVFLSQRNQPTIGRVVMASAGDKNFFGLTLNALDYPGEKFSYDGSKARVALPVKNTPRSYLNVFVDTMNPVLRDSLLGGALNSSWVLMDAAKKPKVGGGGLKKVDGKEYYSLSYSPKGGSDYDVSLFFDKETFRHVRTEYKRTSSAAIGTNPNQSSGFDETRIKIVETFDDFKPQGGLMLPNAYKFVYSETGQRGTREVEWAYSFNEFAFNQPLDEKTFDIDAK
jgi:hypothetical protein